MTQTFSKPFLFSDPTQTKEATPYVTVRLQLHTTRSCALLSTSHKQVFSDTVSSHLSLILCI